MKYKLRVHAIGKFPEIDLNENDFNNIKKSNSVLTNALAIEEKYEILISNYYEFESEVIICATQSMIRQDYQYDHFFEKMADIGRRIVNLLTAARLYRDQISRHVKAASFDKNIEEDFIESKFSLEYDSNVEFRFMEALRNYVQHRGMPSHNIRYNIRRDESGGLNLLVYSIDVQALKERLADDKKFKKTVLEELPDNIDLIKYIRAYIESISNVHCTLRDLLDESVCRARRLIESYIDLYKERCDELLGLTAYCIDGNEVKDSVQLFLEWDNVRIELIKRNAKLINLRNRYVTSKR